MKKEILFMKRALNEAKKALFEDEVPVGAIIVKDNKIIAKAHNQKQNKNMAIDHAEICAKKKHVKN